MISYRFGDEPRSINFTAKTSSSSEPQNFTAPKENISTTSILLSWERPSHISGNPKQLRYKIVYTKKNKKNEDNIEKVESPKIIIEDKTTTTLQELKPYTPYMITIEVIYSLTNTTDSAPSSQPVIIHRQSMLVIYTKPNPPSNLNVTMITSRKEAEMDTTQRYKFSKKSVPPSELNTTKPVTPGELNTTLELSQIANVTWSSLEDKDNSSNHVYTLKWERMVGNGKCKLLDDMLRVSENCDLIPDSSNFSTTDQSHYLLTDLAPSTYYRYQVMIKTLHGSSEYSPAIIQFSGNRSDETGQSTLSNAFNGFTPTTANKQL